MTSFWPKACRPRPMSTMSGRRAFDNHADYLALYGEDTAIPEMARPRITSARMLPATLRARLGIDAAA
jgi:hypothetical protein